MNSLLIILIISILAARQSFSQTDSIENRFRAFSSAVQKGDTRRLADCYFKPDASYTVEFLMRNDPVGALLLQPTWVLESHQDGDIGAALFAYIDNNAAIRISHVYMANATSNWGIVSFVNYPNWNTSQELNEWVAMRGKALKKELQGILSARMNSSEPAAWSAIAHEVLKAKDPHGGVAPPARKVQLEGVPDNIKLATEGLVLEMDARFKILEPESTPNMARATVLTTRPHPIYAVDEVTDAGEVENRRFRHRVFVPRTNPDFESIKTGIFDAPKSGAGVRIIGTEAIDPPPWVGELASPCITCCLTTIDFRPFPSDSTPSKAPQLRTPNEPAVETSDANVVNQPQAKINISLDEADKQFALTVKNTTDLQIEQKRLKDVLDVSELQLTALLLKQQSLRDVKALLVVKKKDNKLQSKLADLAQKLANVPADDNSPATAALRTEKANTEEEIKANNILLDTLKKTSNSSIEKSDAALMKAARRADDIRSEIDTSANIKTAK